MKTQIKIETRAYDKGCTVPSYCYCSLEYGNKVFTISPNVLTSLGNRVFSTKYLQTVFKEEPCSERTWK